MALLSQVIRNLHVSFTMNPSSEGLKDRAATSPALFNRYAHRAQLCFPGQASPRSHSETRGVFAGVC